MAIVKPLIFNATSGTPEVLQASDELLLEAPARFGGLVGFNGAAPVAPASIGADFFGSIDELLRGLAAVGLVVDRRPSSWAVPLTLSRLASIGPYEPGRLITGGLGGWQQLDMPAVVPGVIQAPVAHSGASEINPVTGVAVRTLAYSPILSFGPAAPSATTVMAGALWFDSGANRLKVYDGSAWVDALPANLAALAAASGNGVLTLDGGVARVLSSSAAGRSLVATTGPAAWVEWISTGPSAPWAAGTSASDPAPGGGRPAGVTSAIWCNGATGAETMGFWNEADRSWKIGYVNNPILNALAELRSTVVDGDLFSLRGGHVVRVPIGPDGSSLSASGGALAWRDRFTAAPLPPSGASRGDLWQESSTGRTHVSDGSSWLAIRDASQFSDINASSSALQPGVPLLHNGAGWVLADGRAAATSAVLGVAAAAAAPGAPVMVATSGVVSATEAQWHSAIDSADGLAPGSGLRPGVRYYLSSRAAGVLSQSGGRDAVLVGTALSATHLQLQLEPAPLLGPLALVHQGAAPPAAAQADQLWFNPTTRVLSVAISGTGGAISWSPVGVPAAPPPSVGGAPSALARVEAIDWLADPKAAALRFSRSDGTVETIRLRGTGGAVVTMSDDHTLCIDAPMPPGGGGGGGISRVDGGNFTTGSLGP